MSEDREAIVRRDLARLHAALAAAWDEGYRMGTDDALTSDDTRAEFNRKRHANPYRAADSRGDDS